MAPDQHASLSVATSLADLAGTPLAQALTEPVPATEPDVTLFAASDPRESFASTITNRAGFHGLDHDETTGLLYVRNRWLDPELGRFLQPDPLGYADAPNLYQAFGNNPANFTDPMGLYLCSGTTTECMNFEKERQAILTTSKLSASHPQANAYGDPQINNGVEVSFGQTSGYGVTTAAAVYDSSTQMLGPEVKVEFDPSLTALEWGLAIVHEGQHIMDAMDFISTFKKCPPNTCTQSGDYWWDDSLNITNYETERRAYLVSHDYLKAMGQTFGFGPSKTRIGKGVAKNAVDKNVEKIIKEVDALTPQDVTTQVNWLPLPPNTPKPP